MEGIAIIFIIILGIYLWYRISLHFYNKERETIANKVQNLLNSSPYQVMFRNKDCVKYTKYNCHIAIDAVTKDEILVIDID